MQNIPEMPCSVTLQALKFTHLSPRRPTIFALLAGAAVITAGATPATACGWGGCCGDFVGPCATHWPTYIYVPTYAYSACGGCGWGFERLADPTVQYSSVNQGPQKRRRVVSSTRLSK